MTQSEVHFPSMKELFEIPDDGNRITFQGEE